MHFSIQNVIDGQGITIAVMGMLIVFIGLALIAGFLASLPHALEFLTRDRSAKTVKRAAAKERKVTEEENIHAAIACVVHMELESHESDRQRVTLDVDESVTAGWALSTHRMRHFPH